MKPKFRAWKHRESPEMFNDIAFIDFNKQVVGINYHNPSYRLDEEPLNNVILMQYTGSTDKNGVEIYEGDIIKGRGGLASFIEFDEDDLSFKSVSRYCGKLYVPKGYLNKYTEVIGNIYEHSHLLKENTK